MGACRRDGRMSSIEEAFLKELMLPRSPCLLWGPHCTMEECYGFIGLSDADALWNVHKPGSCELNRS